MKTSIIVLRRTLLVASVMAALHGCANFERIDGNISATQVTADRAISAMENASKPGGIVHVDRPRLAGEVVVIHDVDALPSVFEKPVLYNTSGSQPLSGVLTTISEIAGISIRASEIFSSTSSSSSSASSSSSTSANLSNARVNLNFSGNLKGLLDEVTARYDVSWRYDVKSGNVIFYRYETRAVSMSLPPGKKSVKASINLSGGGGSGGGGSTPSGSVSVDHDQTVDPWTSVMSGIRSILGAKSGNAGSGSGSSGSSGSGGSITVDGEHGYSVANPELGIVTVTARPDYMARVTSYLDSVNARFAKNVMIDVRVYSVSMDDVANAGVSANISLETITNQLGKYSLGIESSGVLQPSSGTPGRITLGASNTGKVVSSEVIVNALSQVGKVSLETQGQVIAVNGQPAPFQNANEINYIESSQTTVIPNVGTTVTTTPGTRVVGFTANFMPMILGDNRIMLQYQLQISNLLGMTQVGSGSSLTMLPQISTQSLQQQAFLKDGESIMLFGFDQSRNTDTMNTGMLSLSRTADTNRNVTVIVIQVSTGGQGNA